MISTGKTIADLLTASAPLTALVGTRIYPLIAPEGTEAPFLLYERAFENQYTKDGLANSNSTISITIISDKYQETIDIATATFNALKSEAKLMSGVEAYAEGAYIQNLTFTFWGV